MAWTPMLSPTCAKQAPGAAGAYLLPNYQTPPARMMGAVRLFR